VKTEKSAKEKNVESTGAGIYLPMRKAEYDRIAVQFAQERPYWSVLDETLIG